MSGGEGPARPLLRLPELGAMASSSALASEAVCLNASRILAGRDCGDERQSHNDDPGHRCRRSVHEELDQGGDLQSREDADLPLQESQPVVQPPEGAAHDAPDAGAGPSVTFARVMILLCHTAVVIAQYLKPSPG